MTSREKILAAVSANKPDLLPLPEINVPVSSDDVVQRFVTVAAGIGTKVYMADSLEKVKEIIHASLNTSLRVIASLPAFSDFAETDITGLDPHSLEDTEVAILEAEMGVAENSALWVPEDNMMQRVLPFICQHLVMIVRKDEIVDNMHLAYEKMAAYKSGYGAFIAGPSKTADIEQSLVLGAHGPRSLTIFLM